jgi:hypothetical protein
MCKWVNCVLHLTKLTFSSFFALAGGFSAPAAGSCQTRDLVRVPAGQVSGYRHRRKMTSGLYPERPQRGGPCGGVNGDSKSTNKRGPSLVGSLGSSCRYKRLLSCLLPALVSPVQNIFPPCTLFQSLFSNRPATLTGSRAGPPVSECAAPVIQYL